MSAIDNVSPDQMSFLTNVKEGHPWGARGRKMKQADQLLKWRKATASHQMKSNGDIDFEVIEYENSDDPLKNMLSESNSVYSGINQAIASRRYIPKKYQTFHENPSHLRNDYE